MARASLALLTSFGALLVACGGSSGNPGAGDASHPSIDGSPSGLDATTHIDGALPADGASPTGPDPAGDGSATVTSGDVSIPGTGSAVVPATVYQPAAGAAPRPLVVISPGFQMERAQYASYAHHLATWGFVVVLTDYADKSFFADHQAMADNVGKVIDWAIGQHSLDVDAAKIATAGHSLGGDISVLAAADDTRVKAVVGWDPVDATSPSVVPEHMTHMTAAIAVVGETTDGGAGFSACAPTAENYAAFYAASPSPAVQLTVANASHMNWVDDPTCALCTLCTAAANPVDPATVHAITRRLTVAWLRKHLLADATMDAWLAAAPAGTTLVTK